jgi:hypothetical protein
MKRAESIESIRKQLAEARKEAQDAMGEFRSWGNPYYEKAWLEAVEKVKLLGGNDCSMEARRRCMVN